tara:strand:+ start:9636 stop:9794 length:159 start_codon:yes stop_codon:yes gene_type:complete
MKKTIELRPTQYYQFKQRANEIKLWFESVIVKGIYYVTADQQALQELGYDDE